MLWGRRAGRGPARRARGARWRWLGLGALAVLLVGCAALAVVWSRVPRDDVGTVEPGALTVVEDARGTWQLGRVAVTVTADRLELREAGRVLWTSDPGSAFLTGGRGSVDWREDRGYFWPSVDIHDRLTEQRVTSVRATPTAVHIAGELSGPDGRSPASFTVAISARSPSGAVLDVATSGAQPLASVGLVSGRTGHAAVHGFGAQSAGFDLDGRLLPIVVREQGVGRGQQPITFLADLTNRGAGGTEAMTYAAWASFVTDDLRGVRLDPRAEASHAFAVADTRRSGQVGLEVWAPRLTAELTSAADPAALVVAQQAGGPRPPLADWALDGAIVGLQGGTDMVRREVAELRRAGAAVSAVWLQDWTGRRSTSFGDRLWWTWQLDRQRYPGWTQLVDELRGQGIRTTTYVNPMLVDAAPKGDRAIRNLFEEARELGHLVERPGGGVYELDQGGFPAALVDLTDPRARGWYAQVIADEVLAEGVDGFMADFGEGLPFDAVLNDGDPRLLHNSWPLLWAQTVSEACRLADRPDCVTWFRSGSLGMAQVAPLFWAGDQLVDFGRADGLPSALAAMLSAGVSGWPLVHSDVGGYTSVDAVVRDYTRPSDLLDRWAELEAFGVVMRTHEGNRPGANEQVYSDPARESSFARMTRVHAALADYRREVVAESVRTGLPALRHGWLVAPGTAAARTDRQFFLGDAVLVAPVLEQGADSVEVSLPPGRWVHLITGEALEGDRRVSVAAPLGTPAAFILEDDPWASRLRAAVRAAL